MEVGLESGIALVSSTQEAGSLSLISYKREQGSGLEQVTQDHRAKKPQSTQTHLAPKLSSRTGPAAIQDIYAPDQAWDGEEKEASSSRWACQSGWMGGLRSAPSHGP